MTRQDLIAFQRNFAAVLDTWAANAERRADDLEASEQPDLFREGVTLSRQEEAA